MEIAEARRGTAVRLSPLFNYYVSRPDPSALDEVAPRDAFAAAASSGISPLALHDPPYTAEGAAHRPSHEAFQRARDFAIPFNVVARKWEYRRLDDAQRLRVWREALQQRLPVAFGFWLTDAYWKIPASANTHPSVGEMISETQHAAVVVGVDDARESFLVKDSQGTAFGEAGYWWLPYRLAASRLILEAWTVDRFA